jgi:hypothetical protein
VGRGDRRHGEAVSSSLLTVRSWQEPEATAKNLPKPTFL